MDPQKLALGEVQPLDAMLSLAEELGTYWKCVAKPLGIRLGALHVAGVKTFPVAEDVCIAEVGLECVTTSAWSLLTVALGMVISNRKSWALHRLLVCNQGQWLMWSGEWLSPAELDFGWAAPGELKQG